MQEFRPPQLAAYLQENSPLLLDVREDWEFDYCHIHGSQLLPMGKIPTQFSQFEPSQEIVIICHHGIRSRQVGRFLEAQGFSNIINLQGGVDAWALEIDKQMATY